MILFANQIQNKHIINQSYKTLGFIVTVYGKDKTLVEKCLDSLLSIRTKVNIVVLYRNSEKHNFDYLLEKYGSFPFIKINDDANNIKKAEKLAIGVNFINSKFFIALDADDWINTSNLDKLLIKLENTKESIISNSIEIYKYSDNTLRYSKPNVLLSANPSTIFPTLAFKEVFNKEDQLPKTWAQHDRFIFYKVFLHVKKYESLDIPVYVWTLNNSNESKSKLLKEDFIKATDSLIEVKYFIKSLLKESKEYKKLLKSQKRSMYWRWYYFYYISKVNFFTLNKEFIRLLVSKGNK